MKQCLSLLLSIIFTFIFSCDKNNPITNTNDIISGTVTDIDGNVYKTLKFGNQIWMAENLRTTRYNDGTEIPLVNDSSKWFGLLSPAYCFYDTTKNTDSIIKYGALYNWYVVNTNKIAPEGWRVPSIDDWKIFLNYLIASGYNWNNQPTGNAVGKSLAAQIGWSLCNFPGSVGNDLTKNNRTGFTAYPSGYRVFFAYFVAKTKETRWWTSTKYAKTESYICGLTYQGKHLVYGILNYNYEGLSIRLVKDAD